MSPPSSGRSSFDQPIGAMPRLTAGLFDWVNVGLRLGATERREAVDVGERHRDAVDRAAEASLADEAVGFAPALGTADGLEDEAARRPDEPDLLHARQGHVGLELLEFVDRVGRGRPHLSMTSRGSAMVGRFSSMGSQVTARSAMKPRGFGLRLTSIPASTRTRQGKRSRNASRQMPAI